MAMTKDRQDAAVGSMAELTPTDVKRELAKDGADRRLFLAPQCPHTYLIFTLLTVMDTRCSGVQASRRWTKEA
jgi:hypothetical protein